MKAMIFAAGLGTRLKPLTDNKPKALVEVGGKTMLELVILKLKEAGFNEIVINIHHFGQQIIDYLKANNNFGLTIHISDERDYLLDTGGALPGAQRGHLLQRRSSAALRKPPEERSYRDPVGQPTEDRPLPVIQ